MAVDGLQAPGDRRATVRRQGLAVLSVAVAGANYMLFVSLQPVLLTAFVDRGNLSLAGASTVLAANMLGAIVGGLLALWCIARLPVRSVVALGAVALAVTQVAAAFVDTTTTNLATMMFGAGAGAGLLGAASMATVAAMRLPGRVFSIIVATQIVTGAVALYFAHRLLQAFGLAGLLVAMGAFAVVSLVLAPFVLEPGHATGREELPPPSIAAPRRQSALLLLSSLALLYVANNAAWAYLEVVNQASGLSGAEISQALGIGQLASLWGAAAAASWQRSRARLGIATGLVIVSAATVLFTVTSGVLPATIEVALLMGALCLALPLYLDLLAAWDVTGGLVVWGQVAVGLGMMLGPLAAVPVAAHGGYYAVMWASAAACLTAMALALAATAGPGRAMRSVERCD